MSIQIPNIPTSPFLEKDGEGKMTGEVSPAWKLWLQQLQAQLGMNFTNEGYVVPQQPLTTITQLNTAKSEGAFLYDSTNSVMRVCLKISDGVYQFKGISTFF